MIARALRILAVLGLGWLLSRVFRKLSVSGQASTGQASQKDPNAAPRVDEQMVRDRICNTFLPRARALRSVVDGNEHFFCSTECRERFRALGNSEVSRQAQGRG